MNRTKITCEKCLKNFTSNNIARHNISCGNKKDHQISLSMFEQIGDLYKCPICNKLRPKMGISFHYWRSHTDIGNQHNLNPNNVPIWNKGKQKKDHPSIASSAIKLSNIMRGKRRAKKCLGDDYKNYRRDCQFKFSLNDFPDKFDFGLIGVHGWYKAKNRGDNPNGISRDHAISIKFGWNNDISPEIIAHPANCILMPHTDNMKKNMKCSLSLEELKIKIENW